MLGFLVGHGIDMKKLEESEGITFKKSRISLLKMILLLLQPLASFAFMFGYVIGNNIR
jgi:hypothetical protein